MIQAIKGSSLAVSMLMTLSQAAADSYPLMQVTVDDSVVDLYLAHFPGIDSGSDNLAEIKNTAPGKDRRYLAYFDSDDSLDPTRYFTPKLLGGSLEYDEDLSEAHCGCDAALYLVRMPATKEDGTSNPTDGYYYCGS